MTMSFIWFHSSSKQVDLFKSSLLKSMTWLSSNHHEIWVLLYILTAYDLHITNYPWLNIMNNKGNRFNSSRSRSWFYLRFDFLRNHSMGTEWRIISLGIIPLGGKVCKVCLSWKFYDFGKTHLVNYDHRLQDIISCLRSLIYLIF